MATEWYYKTAMNKELGPYPPAALKTLVSEGHISLNTLVKKGTDGHWVAAAKVKGLMGREVTRPTAIDPASVVHLPPPGHLSEGLEENDLEKHSPPVSHPPLETRGVTDTEHSGLPPKKVMPRSLLIGAVVGSLLVAVLIVLAFSLSVISDKSNQDQVGKRLPGSPADIEREKKERLVEEKRKAMEEEDRKNAQIFDEAKTVLLKSHDSVGGTLEGNVKKGIELLTLTLSSPDTTNHAEARLLLEHTRVALSDDKAIQFIRALKDSDQRGIVNNENIIVKEGQLEALSRGFSKRFETKVEHAPEETSIFVCSRLSHHNSIETTFYDTLKKNVKSTVEQIADEKKQKAEKRKAAREENPKLTALIFDIQDKPEVWEGQCVYFDKFEISGETDKKSDTDYRLFVTDSRGKTYFGFKDTEIVFSTSKTIAAQINKLTEARRYTVKLYCDMYVSNKGGPYAVVYKIDFYSNGGGIAQTIKD